MEIIFGRENAEELRKKYTVLDLEEITVEDGRSIEVFCLIPLEKLRLNDVPKLPEWTKLHNEMLEGYKNKDYNYVRQCIEHLIGQFGGEVDTFYEELLRRINESEIVD